jgi:hypothetical protein
MDEGVEFEAFPTAVKCVYRSTAWSRDGTWEETPVAFRVAKKPFSHGAMRAAFLAFIRDSTTRYVAKRFLVPSYEEDETKYREDILVQSVAGEVAKAFNTYQPPKPVKFIEAFLVRAGDITWAVEQMLEGEFKKHSNNAGFIDPETRNTPHALSHFSWVHSQKENPDNALLLSDVQGVNDMLTDPGIQSIHPGRYGKLDLGPAGIAFFFSTHECNPICTALKLPKFATPDGASVMEQEHISLRKGKTLPKITRCLTEKRNLIAQRPHSAPSIPKNLAPSSHLLVPLIDTVPLQATPDAVVYLSLAGLHEKGHLAALYESLRLSSGDGSDKIEAKPNLESALFFYQRAALGGHVEAQMIMAQLHAGFTPRDTLESFAVVDPKRALFYLELAAQRKHRAAVFHLADVRLSQNAFAVAAELFVEASQLPRLSAELPIPGLPWRVWDNDPELHHAYAHAAQAYEKAGNFVKAAEYFNSAAEEGFANPLLAKQAMAWQEQAAKCEAKAE